MPYGVTLFIDKESESAIRQVWSHVRDAGLSSFMIDNDVRPHITLAVYEELDVEAFLEKFAGFVNELSPISFSLSIIGTFLNPRGTVFLAPTVTHRLMNIHSRFHNYFHDLEHSLSEYSLPGRWFPHFTVAGGIAEDKIPQVIDIGLKASLPEQSRIEDIGIGEFEYKEDSPSYFVSWLYSFAL